MASKFKRPFILLLTFSWVLVACFVGFQYQREKQHKVDKLDGQLQIYNQRIIEDLDASDAPWRVPTGPYPEIRVSIIGGDGKLLFDNTLDTLSAENHLDRPEIAEAMATGHGYTLRRHSASTDETYFYSATKGKGVIVRSAVPYSLTLQEILDAGNLFFWFLFAITIAISLVGYYMYRLNVQLEHEQQEKTRIKKQLTNNINHELKTPVASIKVCLETIKEHPDLPKEKLWPFIEQSYQHTQRLTNLLNDVSSITRMDDGSANIEKTALDLKEIIEQECRDAIHRVRAEGAGIEVVTSLRTRHGASLPIHGNRQFLASIFSNLINNAIAYSGGTRITISLDDESDKSYTFSVADNGCGIPEEHLERIFERFYRIDKGRSRQLGGTGLGLSIVRNAVQLHGGTIHATNLPTGGLKFTFTLAK